MNKKFAEIIINNKSSRVDKPFTYILEGEFIHSVKVGMRVVVPFGRTNKLTKGLVINIKDTFHDSYKLKGIVDVIDDKSLVSGDLIELSMWMKDEYLSSYNDCFRQVFPPGDFKTINTIVKVLNNSPPDVLSIDEIELLDYLKDKDEMLLQDIKKQFRKPFITNIINSLENKSIVTTRIDIINKVEKKYEKQIRLTDSDLSLEQMKEIVGNRAKQQMKIIEFLYSRKDVSFKELSAILNTTLDTVKSVEKKELLIIYEKEVNRDPIKNIIPKYEKHELSNKQRDIFLEILEDNKNTRRGDKFLIRGVTGSGKTEIYLQLVEEMIKREKQSIILVPEISLTPQTIDRFVGRFGDLVAVLHSRLSYGERFDEWRKIKNGEVKIVVGARSAVFAPFENLGLIVIDEEHETTYKSSQNPKYDTIEVASKRVEIEDAILVLGSATPSLLSYHKALNKEIKLLELDERINNYNLPDVNVIDMREELKIGNKSMYSRELYNSIEDNLKNKRQTILFLNRRGFSTFVSCRECGYVVKCDSCDISMTYHRNIDKVRCHYCGLSIPPPKTCPVCKSNYIRYFGIGTEQVEEYTRNTFPKARVSRMDFDTTSKKGSYEKILSAMKNGKIDILIGTQMISKGLDFKNVTLVGVIAADTALNLPDFRAPERTFQLITQVAGRAGRGEDEGKVIVQTYNPDHYSIILSKKHDFKGFYYNEIKLRKEFMYPPYYDMINLLIYGENVKIVSDISRDIYKLIYKEIDFIDENNKKYYIIGPHPAPLEKIKNNYRWNIIIKSDKQYMRSFKNILKRVLINNEYNLSIKDIKISIDINPNSIL